MKVRFNSRIALFYPASFENTQELELLLKEHKIEMRMVEESGLSLSAAALAGYIDNSEPTREYDAGPLEKSTLVFSGLTEERLNTILEAIKKAEYRIDFKAVLTGENRSWAFGVLINELALENEKQENNQA